jgi:hypothetical protein
VNNEQRGLIVFVLAIVLLVVGFFYHLHADIVDREAELLWQEAHDEAESKAKRARIDAEVTEIKAPRLLAEQREEEDRACKASCFPSRVELAHDGWCYCVDGLIDYICESGPRDLRECMRAEPPFGRGY